VAFALDDITRTAWAIVCSEQGGATFNWSKMAFEEPTP
jgi:hypothetical protein